MLFNSLDFAIFLPSVFLLYWFVFNKSLKLQNFFLLIVSYVFYGWWDWRFLSLLFLTSTTDFYIGFHLNKIENPSQRKLLLYLSLALNLGMLGFFKYFNFFLDNANQLFTYFGQPVELSALHIILPAGISFYTFQSLSYTIDIYRKHITPTKSLIEFLSFVSFFPHLVAGPIMRASTLLPQFKVSRLFDYEIAKDGLRQILWGLFKKMVVADNLAHYVDTIFGNYEQYNGTTLAIGAVYFAYQVYADFSAYSDIACGIAKLFGFQLMVNFKLPYFSRDVAEYWRRNHISLTTWFRDYLYIPLGGSNGSKRRVIRNILIIFIVSGFWHGANWTFIIWGLLNAIYFIPLLLLHKNRQHMDTVAQGKLFPSIKEFFQMTFTFCLIAFGLIWFRSVDITHAIGYIKILSHPSLLFESGVIGFEFMTPLLLIFIVTEWIQRENEHVFVLTMLPKFARWCIYILTIYTIIYIGKYDNQAFIYFQF